MPRAGYTIGSSASSDDRLSPTDVLYLESDGPVRCDRCHFFIPGTSECHLFPKKDAKVSGPDGACNFFVHAKGDMADKQPEGILTKEEAGYGADEGVGGYQCGNCKYGSNGYCHNPSIVRFKIDPIGGCCTGWESDKPIKKAQMK